MEENVVVTVAYAVCAAELGAVGASSANIADESATVVTVAAIKLKTRVMFASRRRLLSFSVSSSGRAS